ncbi:MAG: Fur family transcriptional regulator [Spirochaetales bacterium]|uniref:Fur family transcriptional regulator n=1 Tax=Candidatus Thalassospirochaeta sargassi TaxID=3119039 RepID=A0AAJ1IBI9_9SPIO|nr:Fur family transcriptional regulator [Spirochaetales bacterium]
MSNSRPRQRMKPCCMELEGGIRNRGLRMTLPRQLVAQVLESADGYLSAEDIYSIIREEYPAIGLATVYRTLVLLDEMGIVNRYNFGEGRARYIAAEDQTAEHHHQLICERCYKVIKYSDFSEDERELYKKVESVLSEKHGFEIKRHIVQFHGICPDCRKESQNESSNSDV